MQEVARYPNEIVQSSSNQYCGPTYPSLILPFSRIHIKLGGCSTRPGKALNVLALPAGFPLALGFADILSKHTVEIFGKEKNAVQVVECGKALSMCLESLCKVVARLNCPHLLKILLLHQMADILWTLCYIFKDSGSSERPPVYSFPNEFLQSIRQELTKVFETETSKFPGKNKSMFPPPGSVACGGSGRFSTYFQAILEFVLAAAKYQDQFHNTQFLPAPSTSTAALMVTPPSLARATSSEATPTGAPSGVALAPSVADLTKKPTKKPRSRKATTKKDSQSESSMKNKKDDWLSTVHSAASLLRTIVLNQSQNSLSQEAGLSCQGKTKPTARLIIVTGIDRSLRAEDVHRGIRKLCNVYGGLYRDLLYLPTEQVSEEVADSKEQAEGMSGTDSANVKTSVDKVESDETASTEQILGCAVLELCSSTQVSPASTAILTSPALKVDDSSVQVCTISDSLKCGENDTASEVLMNYLREKLLKDDSLCDQAKQALSEIFKSSLASKSQLTISIAQISNNLKNFMSGFASESGVSMEELASGVWKSHGNKDGLIEEEGFLAWVCGQVKLVTGEGVKRVWLGLLASGYDFHFDRYVYKTVLQLQNLIIDSSQCTVLPYHSIGVAFSHLISCHASQQKHKTMLLYTMWIPCVVT